MPCIESFRGKIYSIFRTQQGVLISGVSLKGDPTALVVLVRLQAIRFSFSKKVIKKDFLFYKKVTKAL